MIKRYVLCVLTLLVMMIMLFGCAANGIFASVSVPVVEPMNVESGTAEPTVSPTSQPTAAPTAAVVDSSPHMGSAGGIVTDTSLQKPTITDDALSADTADETTPLLSDGASALDAAASVSQTTTQVHGENEIDPDKPMIALTFDDGPSSDATKSIIDTLEQYNVHATFFVQGVQVVKNPWLTSRAHDIGCEIGNHTYSHMNLTKATDKEFTSEVDGMVEMIQELTDTAPALLRPPYGARDDRVRALSKYPLILWSIDTLDWSTRDTQSTVDAVLNYVRDGDIVLMHDLYTATAEAVKIIVPELINRGYQLVTVSEMFEAKGITFEAGKDYRKTY